MSLKPVLLASVLSALGGPSWAAFPEFHGQETELRWALRQIKTSRMVDGYVWTIGAVAIVVQLYPAPMDFREEDIPPGFPVHVSWIGPVRTTDLYDPSLLKRVEAVVRKSDIVLLIREQDGRTCILNQLCGQRIFEQSARAQNATAVRLPCEQVWSRPEMPEVSDSDRQSIIELLKTPPAPPKFLRRRR